MTMHGLRFSLLVGIFLVACSDDPAGVPGTDSGAADSGTAGDASASDLGTSTDGGSRDAGFDADVIIDSGVDANVRPDLGADAGFSIDSGSGGDAGMCLESVSDEGLYAGAGCDDGEEVCPSDYECFSMTGIVAGPPHCEIPCTTACECPDEFTCATISDKAGTHHFCRLPESACLAAPGGGAVGVTCDPGDAEACGTGYECAANTSALGTTYSCEIKCRADCECPGGYACQVRTDLSGTRRFCHSDAISSS
ncbi:MAG: hypothetical protein IPK60_08180 [Sandaracinaceae bacterium]|jgi:hypothetical protein|nr:hypothetical protein [Sandaracinaceae bacterium]